MPMTIARQEQASTINPILHVAFEMSEKHWKLAFTTGLGQRPRVRTVPARDLEAVWREIAGAQRRFRLAGEARVVSCYEAGMDGFWFHRVLLERGVENVVVDSSSIDVKRRQRRAKTDKLDARALVTKLVEYVGGHRRVWSVVRVPPVDAEDLRQTHRELQDLKEERGALVCKVRGLLKTEGIRLQTLKRLPAQLTELRRWDGTPLGAELTSRLERVWARLEVLEAQIHALAARQETLVAAAPAGAPDVVAKTIAVAQQLAMLKSVGPVLSWALATELFGWRTFNNRRQVGALVGLVGVPAQSGESYREQAISRAGNPRLRALLVEFAWGWLRYQPESALSQWYQRRFAAGSKRVRRIGIVAVARKLVIELWKYLETGALPAGAVTKA